MPVLAGGSAVKEAKEAYCSGRLCSSGSDASNPSSLSLVSSTTAGWRFGVRLEEASACPWADWLEDELDIPSEIVYP